MDKGPSTEVTKLLAENRDRLQDFIFFLKSGLSLPSIETLVSKRSREVQSDRF